MTTPPMPPGPPAAGMAPMPPAVPGPPAAAAHFAAGGVPAGFWIRLAAYLIDSILVDGVVFGLIKVTGAIKITTTCYSTTGSFTDCYLTTSSTSIDPIFYALVAIPVVYFVLLWALGGTLGQRLLGMRVVNAQTGGNLGIARALLRYVGFLVSAAALFIGLIWVGFDARKQGWHDKIATSLVLRRR